MILTASCAVPYYLDQLAKGELRPAATLTVLKEDHALLMADGHWGFGQVLARELTGRLIAKAGEQGVCVGTLIHSGHIGRLGEYCEQAAEAGMVSLVMVNTHGGRARRARSAVVRKAGDESPGFRRAA